MFRASVVTWVMAAWPRGKEHGVREAPGKKVPSEAAMLGSQPHEHAFHNTAFFFSTPNMSVTVLVIYGCFGGLESCSIFKGRRMQI